MEGELAAAYSNELNVRITTLWVLKEGSDEYSGARREYGLPSPIEGSVEDINAHRVRDLMVQIVGKTQIPGLYTEL